MSIINENGVTTENKVLNVSTDTRNKVNRFNVNKIEVSGDVNDLISMNQI